MKTRIFPKASALAALVCVLMLCFGTAQIFAAENAAEANATAAQPGQSSPAGADEAEGKAAPAAASQETPAAPAAQDASAPQAAQDAPAAQDASAPPAAQDASAPQAAQEPAVPQAAPAPAAPQSRLEAAIASGIADGKIDPSQPTGLLGIPGAPNVSPVLAFAWAIWVGWIFSTVGAFGGVMASVGHISVFGLGEYAASFGKGTAMNKTVTDSIRVSNQWLVGCSSLVSSFKYWTMGRVVLPLALALGVGSVAGAIITPILSAGRISFRDYVGYFGIFVLGLGCYLLYETLPAAAARKKKAAAAAKAFEEASTCTTGEDFQTRVKVLSVSPSRVVFTFCGVEFSFSTLLPVIFGFIVSSVASFLGVGGGFLIVPFLTSISQLPMYLAAGTSALVVLVGMVTSISTFMFGGTPVHWPLIGVELCGIVLGSWVGPMTAKYLPDVWLKRLFILLAFVVGINYVLRGFTAYRLW